MVEKNSVWWSIHYFLFIRFRKIDLTHLPPMHSFSTPGKYQKTLRFSDVFRGLEKRFIGNKWVKAECSYFSMVNQSQKVVILFFLKSDLLCSPCMLYLSSEVAFQRVLKIYSKFTGDHPCRRVISV